MENLYSKKNQKAVYEIDFLKKYVTDFNYLFAIKFMLIIKEDAVKLLKWIEK